jgi:hypothetical protein
VRVVSEFKAGKFEQTLEGALFMFPIPSGKNTAATAGNPNGAQNGDQGRQKPRLDARNRQNAAADPRTFANRTAAINNNNGADSASAQSNRCLAQQIKKCRGCGQTNWYPCGDCRNHKSKLTTKCTNCHSHRCITHTIATGPASGQQWSNIPGLAEHSRGITIAAQCGSTHSECSTQCASTRTA